MTEEFDIGARAAARLVSDNPEVIERLSQAEMQRQRQADPLADVPSPNPKHADYYPVPSFESVKPVAVENDRTGAG